MGKSFVYLKKINIRTNNFEELYIYVVIEIWIALSVDFTQIPKYLEIDCVKVVPVGYIYIINYNSSTKKM